MTQLGWKASPDSHGLKDVLEFATLADQEGFDLVDVSEFFQLHGSLDHSPSLWAFAGALAGRIKRAVLGLKIPYDCLRADPVSIAKAAQTLSALAPERVYLTLETGETPNEYSEDDWPNQEERLSITTEAMELIRQFWAGRPFSFKGKHFNTRQIDTGSFCGEPVPMVLSCPFPGSAQFAGMHGDGLMTEGGRSLAYYSRMLYEFELGAIKVNRDPNKLPKAITLKVTNRSDAPSMARQFIELGFTQIIFETDLRSSLSFLKESRKRIMPVVQKSGKPANVPVWSTLAAS